MIHTRSRDAIGALVVADGSLGREVVGLLAEASLGLKAVTPDDAFEPGDFTAVALVTDRPYADLAARLDQRCWEASVPWLEATMVAHKYRIGPVVVPGRTPCRDCWLRRIHSQARDPAVLSSLEQRSQASGGSPWFRGELWPLLLEVAALAAAELMATATGRYAYPARGLGRFLEGDAVFGSPVSRVFARIGRCRRCSQGEPVESVQRLADGVRGAAESEAS